MAAFRNHIQLEWRTRSCMVDGKPGNFQTWELFSEPCPASPFPGGAPAGAVSRVYGIVEFADCVKRVDPTQIRFTDADSADLCSFTKCMESGENQ